MRALWGQVVTAHERPDTCHVKFLAGQPVYGHLKLFRGALDPVGASD